MSAAKRRNAGERIVEPDCTYRTIAVVVSKFDVGGHTHNEHYILPPRQDEAYRRSALYRHRSRAHTPQLGQLKLQLSIDKRSANFMKDPSQGHKFGSDPAICDILLDTSVIRYISGEYFNIRFDTSGKGPPKGQQIVNKSDNELIVEKQSYRTGQHAVLNPGETKQVVAGTVILDVTFPNWPLNSNILSCPSGCRRCSDQKNSSSVYQEIRPPDTPMASRSCRLESLTGAVVAVKIIADPGTRLTLEDKHRELDIMHKVTEHPHDNIVKLLDHAQFPVEPHPTLLVLEYTPYGTLENLYCATTTDSYPTMCMHERHCRMSASQLPSLVATHSLLRQSFKRSLVVPLFFSYPIPPPVHHSVECTSILS
ncbi:hypothetical protein LTR82_017783 [Friedmanniomyces endolithicus]|uniref:Protein kinase domain-containing protein n=1 Tax=Friedmanniomyces endolithicus TaxID=329885 RepID=A0AAN6F3J2_9PEZI|nr:hypothetical protein LTR82_017783 [Friedmanniomyces endolithicus]